MSYQVCRRLLAGADGEEAIAALCLARAVLNIPMGPSEVLGANGAMPSVLLIFPYLAILKKIHLVNKMHLTVGIFPSTDKKINTLTTAKIFQYYHPKELPAANKLSELCYSMLLQWTPQC